MAHAADHADGEAAGGAGAPARRQAGKWAHSQAVRAVRAALVGKRNQGGGIASSTFRLMRQQAAPKSLSALPARSGQRRSGANGRSIGGKYADALSADLAVGVDRMADDAGLGDGEARGLLNLVNHPQVVRRPRQV